MGPRPGGSPDGVTSSSVAPVLSCRELSKGFGGPAVVDAVSFEVAAGEAYGLIGPNGAGKTTTIRMICGILPADGGDVRLGGRLVDRTAREALGYVPQEVALLPNLTVVENLRFWARMYGVRRTDRADRVDEVLMLVGLTHAAGERVDRCSGGMQRRLNLAVALLHRPRLLVLDEPTVGIDTQSRAALLVTLGELRDGGLAVLYTSHYLDEVEQLCDRVGVIDHGQLVVEGTPAELVDRRGDGGDLEDLFLALTGRELRD